MKLYILPIESTCNARCRYCITKGRHFNSGILDLGSLQEILNQNEAFDKIEITGGGEPSLHPNIADIISLCAEKLPTQIYTNGTLDTAEGLRQLSLVCLSRAHYDDDKNFQIMGVKYDVEKFAGLPLKLSLLVHKSGISTEEEIKKYLEWAKGRAKKVVIRQLFEYTDKKYEEYYRNEFVPTSELFIDQKARLENGNRSFIYDGIEVEIEERACACEDESHVLHANGELKKGWQ